MSLDPQTLNPVSKKETGESQFVVNMNPTTWLGSNGRFVSLPFTSDKTQVREHPHRPGHRNLPRPSVPRRVPSLRKARVSFLLGRERTGLSVVNNISEPRSTPRNPLLTDPLQNDVDMVRDIVEDSRCVKTREEEEWKVRQRGRLSLQIPQYPRKHRS